MLSTVCSHPQRPKIDQLLLAGVSLRKIAASVSPPISFQAIQRYKQTIVIPAIRSSLPPSLQAPSDVSEQTKHIAAEVLKSPVRARIEQLWGVAERSLAKAESAVRVVTDDDGNQVVIGADLTAIAPLLNQAHKNLEIHGQLTGELTNASAAPPASMVRMIMFPHAAALQGSPAVAIEATGNVQVEIAPAAPLEPPIYKR